MYQNNFYRKRYSYRTNNRDDDNGNGGNAYENNNGPQHGGGHHNNQGQGGGYSNKSHSHYRDKEPKAQQPTVRKFQVYGKEIAVEFICENVKRHKLSTVSMHVANRREDVPHNSYDWDNKMSIQIPRVELPLVTAILLGHATHARFKQKSIYGERSYAFLHKDNKLTIHIFEEDKPERSIRLLPTDTYHVTELFLRQLKENSPWMNVGEIVALLKQTLVRLRKNPDQEGTVEVEVPEDGSEDAYGFEGDDAADDFADSDQADEGDNIGNT